MHGDKINPSIYIPSEISGFFWVDGKQPKSLFVLVLALIGIKESVFCLIG